MSLMAMIKGRSGPSGFGYASTAEDVTAGLDLAGKTILVTGVTSGLGRETARVLAKRGAHVIGTGRSADTARETLESFGTHTTAVACELSEPASVRQAAAEIGGTGRALDAVIFNAGIMALPKLQQKHGYELQFLTNHMGHFMLMQGIMDVLAPDARVVVVSSTAHTGAPRGGIQFDNLSGERGYGAWRAYGQAKIANLLFAKELARRFEGTGRTANSLHPGVIITNLGRHMNPVMKFGFGVASVVMCKTVEQGAATECYLAVHPGAARINGEYFDDCNISRPRADGTDADTARRLWEVSEEIAARFP
ncbi:SDR family oxidoreductase [Emcibacter sp. SYSU 3D8]|uniref:SDR family oxidoreductase n=1 Tax=Emcibacter sp. SYSU 3D8 TaxID=3133969 RepID=UPI0031FEE106